MSFPPWKCFLVHGNSSAISVWPRTGSVPFELNISQSEELSFPVTLLANESNLGTKAFLLSRHL